MLCLCIQKQERLWRDMAAHLTFCWTIMNASSAFWQGSLKVTPGEILQEQPVTQWSRQEVSVSSKTLTWNTGEDPIHALQLESRMAAVNR
jgi:hypothetical protein